MQDSGLLVALAQAMLVVIPLALSLAVQQYALARVATWLGDDTAQRAGRLTLNPLVHIDPVGSLLLPLLTVLLAGQGTMLPLIGWARPAPVDLTRMAKRHSRQACAAALAAAGPAASMMLTFVSAAALVGSWHAVSPQLGALADFGSKLLFINVALSLFQLLPIGPLSGFVLLCTLLPAAWVPAVREANERFGQWLLILLLIFGRGILGPPVRFVAGNLLAMVAHLFALCGAAALPSLTAG